MGAKVSKILFGGCNLFIENFPANIARVTLPYIIMDLLPIIGCSGSKINVLLNSVGHGGLIVGALLLSKMDVFQKVGQILSPFGFSKEINSFLLLYVAVQVILILISLTSSGSIEEECQGIVTHPKKLITCLGKIIGSKARKPHPLGCDTSEDEGDDSSEQYQAGLCYSKCDETKFKPVGPICYWRGCGEYSELFIDIGLFCDPKDTYHRKVELVKPKCRTGFEYLSGACYSKAASFTQKDIGIDKLSHKASCASIFTDTNIQKIKESKKRNYQKILDDLGVDWFRSTKNTCHRPIRSEKAEEPCPIGYEKKDLKCYPPAEEGFICEIGGTKCRRKPPIAKGWYKTGEDKEYKWVDLLGYAKPNYARGVGKPIHTCGEDRTRIGALCYDDCNIFDTEDKKYENRGLLCVLKT